MSSSDVNTKTDVAMMILAAVSLVGLDIVMVAQNSDHHISNEVRGPIYQIELVGKKALVVGDFQTSQLGMLSDEGTFESISNIDKSQLNGKVGSLAFYKDHSFLGGDFTSYGQTLVGHLAKLNVNGELDREFLRNMGTGFDDTVDLVHLLNNGDLIVAGRFRSYNGKAAEGVAYIYNNGSLKKDFEPSQGLNGSVHSVSQGPQGDVVLAGDFTQWKTQPKPYVFHISL